jgi:hypothetical protein
MKQKAYNVEQLIAELNEMSKELTVRRQELLKLQTSDFIRSFVELTTAIDQLDSTRELLLGRAESLLSQPHVTERKLRKEHLKLIYNRKLQ